MRRKILLMTFPRNLAEFPLESGMTAWGLYIAIEVIAGQPPSSSLRGLPPAVMMGLGVLMLIAGVSVMSGIFWKKRYRTVARGMYLFSATMVAYAATVVGTSGWSRGGAVAGLLAMLSAVCLLRGWWLKDRESALVKEMERTLGTTDA
jgi:hypothetical protein